MGVHLAVKLWGSPIQQDRSKHTKVTRHSNGKIGFVDGVVLVTSVTGDSLK